ncbi:MAG: hypothetical protein ACPF9K_00530 [Neptuniibacter sp.]
MESNFSEREWNGEFFSPDDFENRFFGTVTFSPEKGVILSYRIVGFDLPIESEVLHGVLETGEACTLIGTFNCSRSGYRSLPDVGTRFGKSGFYFLVIGKFLGEEELFSEISFSLTGMQEFFYPKGFKDQIKYSNEPLFTAATGYGQLEVTNDASFSMLGADISAQIHNTNDEAIADLKQAIEEIDCKHDDSSFMLRKEFSYMVRITTQEECTVSSLYEHITDISNLFAILIFSPVYPELIKLKHVDGNGYSFNSTIYPSMALERRTADLCQKERSHFLMPITKSNIDLESTVKNWLRLSKKFTTIVSSIQHETGFRNEHSVHGELVMYATQLESIAHSAGIENSKKYEYPVTQYGTGKIEKSLSMIFSNAGEADFGQGISELRNEIAHVGKPKKLLISLSLRNMVDISHLLQITIIGYVLDVIGIDKKVISEYQDKYTPRL